MTQHPHPRFPCVVVEGLIATERVTVDIYRFDPNCKIDLHSHNDLEAILIAISGELHLIVNEKYYTLKEFGVVHIRRNEEHSLWTLNSNAKVWVIEFKI